MKLAVRDELQNINHQPVEKKKWWKNQICWTWVDDSVGIEAGLVRVETSSFREVRGAKEWKVLPRSGSDDLVLVYGYLPILASVQN